MIIFEQCFSGLIKNHILSNKNYLFIKHANRIDSYRIFAKYNTVSSSSVTNTFREDYENLLGINLTNGNEWQWHHVVEGTHIEQIFSKADADRLYRHQIPTVLIHQATEHIDYNLLHAHGVKTVFNLSNKKAVLSGKERTNCIAALQNLYANVYRHDHVLKTVSSNIFRLV